MKPLGYIDISYPIDNDIAIYPGNPAFDLERVQDIDCGDSVRISMITMGSHTGTHIDAPSHFIENGENLDTIPLERMNGKATVVDATNISDIDVELLQSIDIDRDSILLFKTNNSVVWECDRVLNDYVTLTYEAADYLAEKKIKLVGIDYLTVERPRSKRIDGYSVHRSLLRNGILICEALKLKDISAGEYEFICLPLKIKGVDGCPTRCALHNIE